MQVSPTLPYLPGRAHTGFVDQHLLLPVRCTAKTACPSVVCLSELPKWSKLAAAVAAVWTACRKACDKSAKALNDPRVRCCQVRSECNSSQRCCRQHWSRKFGFPFRINETLSREVFKTISFNAINEASPTDLLYSSKLGLQPIAGNVSPAVANVCSPVSVQYPRGG